VLPHQIFGRSHSGAGGLHAADLARALGLRAAFKIPGRVGDSPLVGCRVYADDNEGTAAATGDGELGTNCCTSISIVHLMARGAAPQNTCIDLLHYMVKADPRNKDGEVALIAINTRGKIGAAGMNDSFHLRYPLWRNYKSHLLESSN
jgi:N4-(beta-N-acetylglucosaminyl)-L-asparaginase